MRFSELDGAAVGVWGAGRETRSFAAQLARRLPSARLAVVASDVALDQRARESLVAPNARFVAGPQIGRALSECDVVVRSPGVSIYRSEVQELHRRATPVTTATALWLEEHGSERVVGVTGTKGKSTMTALLAHLARAAGSTAALAGNIGVPALDLLDEPEADVTVIELSSYQIADLGMGPEVAVLTNLYPEHVDWAWLPRGLHGRQAASAGAAGVRTTVVNAREPLLLMACTRRRGATSSSASGRFPTGSKWSLSGTARGGSMTASRPLWSPRSRRSRASVAATSC